MNILQKHELLDLAIDLELRGVKISIDFSANQIVTITILANTEEPKIDFQKTFYPDDNIESGIQEIEAFIKNRKFEIEVA